MSWTDSSDAGVGATLATGAERELSKHRAHKRAARTEMLSDEVPGVAMELHDRVIGHLFGSRLMLASIVSLGKVDTEVAERLRYVLDELETAVRDIRRNDYVLSVRDHGPRPGPPPDNRQTGIRYG
jgi:signal transduction histidine kinase